MPPALGAAVRAGRHAAEVLTWPLIVALTPLGWREALAEERRRGAMRESSAVK
jgi:hypothetical protein